MNQEQKDMLAIMEALKANESNEQPFLSTDDKGKPVIVGDTNQVETTSNYTVDYLYPLDALKSIPGAVEKDGYALLSKEYKQVTITPRKARRLRNDVANLVAAFSKVNENNAHELLTINEVIANYKILDDVVVDAMEHVVSIALEISEADIEYISDESLLDVTIKLIERNAGFFQ